MKGLPSRGQGPRVQGQTGTCGFRLWQQSLRVINSVGKINKTFYKIFIEQNRVLKSCSLSLQIEKVSEKNTGWKAMALK